MHINFQENVVSRSVKTEHTNLFAKTSSVKSTPTGTTPQPISRPNLRSIGLLSCFF